MRIQFRIHFHTLEYCDNILTVDEIIMKRLLANVYSACVCVCARVCACMYVCMRVCVYVCARLCVGLSGRTLKLIQKHLSLPS